MLTYFGPFMNEKRFNLWFSHCGTGHEISGLEDDRHHPKLDMGKNEIIMDRLTE